MNLQFCWTRNLCISLNRYSQLDPVLNRREVLQDRRMELTVASTSGIGLLVDRDAHFGDQHRVFRSAVHRIQPTMRSRDRPAIRYVALASHQPSNASVGDAMSYRLAST